MSGLELFRYGSQDVRVVDRGGDPWFVAADVARLLGYGHTPSAMRMLDDDMKGVQIMHTPGGDQEMTLVSEPGLYRLIMRSQRPEAREIERWVVGTVLPAIRRTGSFATAVSPVLDVSAVDRRTLALAVIAAEDARDAAEARAAALEPAAEAWRTMADGDGHLSLTAAAKALQSSGARIKAKEFYAWLHQKRWTYRAGGVGDWLPYADVLDRGWMTTRLVRDHDGRTKPQARVTVLGMERLRAMLIAERGDAGHREQTALQLVVGGGDR